MLAFHLPKALLAASHGIEGMHLHVDEPRRWDAVTGVSVYGGGGVWAPGRSSYGADAAFGALVPVPGR